MAILVISNSLGRLKRHLWTSVDNYVYASFFGVSDKTIPSPLEFECWRIRDRNHLSDSEDDGKLRYLLGKGCNVYLARWNGDIAGRYVSCKLSHFKPYAYNEHKIFQGDESYYIFFCHTYEPFRGRNIFPLILGQICSEVWQECPQSIIYSSADVGNRSSQRALDKAGFRLVGHLKYRSILNHPMKSCLEPASDMLH